MTKGLKLEFVRNRKQHHSESEDDEEDEEMPGETGAKLRDKSELDESYVLIRTNAEEDAIQIHTGKEIENCRLRILNQKRGGQAEIFTNRIDTGEYRILKTSNTCG